MSAGAGWSELSVFLALARSEPDWHEVTVDHGDVRLGGFVLGGAPERLQCANLHPADEVELPAPELHVFFVAEDPPEPMRRLRWLRRHRASEALDRIERARARDEEPEREFVRWSEELAQARSVREDEVAPAAGLLEKLLQLLPGPWELTRVVRNEDSGGLWAFGLDRVGDLVVGSHDVEARRSGDPPSFLWIPRRGQTALREFLGLGEGCDASR